MDSMFPLTSQETSRRLFFRPKLEGYRPQIERCATLLFEYIQTVDILGGRARVHMADFTESYNQRAHNVAQSPSPVPNLSDKDYVQYLLMLQNEVHKPTNTVEDCIQVASAAYNLIAHTQNYIATFPASVQRDIIRQVDILNRMFLAQSSAELWAPPTWSPQDRPILHPPQSELSLSRAQIGSIVRQRMFEAQEDSDRMLASQMPTVPPNSQLLPLSAHQKRQFKSNPFQLLGQTFLCSSEDGEDILFEVASLSRSKERHDQYKLHMSDVGEVDVEEDKFWRLVGGSRMYQ
ncbi:hypothetical protein VKT23_019188 [Stygiomarasmius scandens]|uniref:Uncharacterized protein n=1 Tax=Marasmiellus scandens TaxID=2682957 RepID=A0ABR1IM75_9AGAR